MPSADLVVVSKMRSEYTVAGERKVYKERWEMCIFPPKHIMYKE